MSQESHKELMDELIPLLQEYPVEGGLSEIVNSALVKISQNEILSVSPKASGNQSSAEIVDIYDLRKRMNYFVKDKVQGIDETINSLSSYVRPINLRIINLNNCLITLWIESNHQTLSGIMIFNTSVNESKETSI